MSDIERRWQQLHPTVPPIGFLLAEEYPDRHLRIHSLPRAKRWPTTGREHAEIRRRHATMAADVLGERLQRATLFYGERSGRTVREAATAIGMPAASLPLLWDLPDKMWDPDDGCFSVPIAIFGSMSALTPAQFESLVSLVAEDRCRAIVADLESCRIYAPYDGGADLFYPTEVDRDAAAIRFESWLPSEADDESWEPAPDERDEGEFP